MLYAIAMGQIKRYTQKYMIRKYYQRTNTALYSQSDDMPTAYQTRRDIGHARRFDIEST